MSTLTFVENDHLPELAVTYDGVDLTGYQALELHIRYRPNALVISGTVVSAAAGTFKFTFDSKVESTLKAAAEAEATSVKIQNADYASFPDSGELVLGSDETRETVRYSSKTAPDTLNLQDALSYDHDVDEAITKLGDLRAGRWDAEISVTDSTGKTRTFSRLKLDVIPEIA